MEKQKKHKLELEQLTQSECLVISGGDCSCTCLSRPTDVIGVGAISAGKQLNAATCASYCTAHAYSHSRCV